MSKGIFITATGTNTGKTYISALITKELRQSGFKAGYYKTALSGAERIEGEFVPGDVKFVFEFAKIPGAPQEHVSYILEPPVAPHLAAGLEGVVIDIKKIQSDFKRISQEYEYITVEGSGGIVCPLRYDDERLMLTDVIKELGLDIVVVAPAGLGTINHTVLTVEYAKQQGLGVKGIILNGYDENNYLHNDNRKVIEKLTGTEVVAVVGQESKSLNMQIEKLLSLYGEVGIR